MGEELLVSLAADGLRNVKEDISQFFSNPVEFQEVFQTQDTARLAEIIWDEYEKKIRTEGMESAYRWSSFFFSGWKKAEFLNYTNLVWKRSIKQKRISIYFSMQKLIQFLKENKVKVIFDSKVKEGGKCRLYEKNYIIIPSTYNLEKKLSILI
ncbi:MAG: hypothetical protein N3A69_09890, partial [Leptospiraceae bacterium]|nr:hypothetical protein [Leptospiraceae bacterium]